MSEISWAHWLKSGLKSEDKETIFQQYEINNLFAPLTLNPELETADSARKRDTHFKDNEIHANVNEHHHGDTPANTGVPTFDVAAWLAVFHAIVDDMKYSASSPGGSTKMKNQERFS